MGVWLKRAQVAVLDAFRSMRRRRFVSGSAAVVALFIIYYATDGAGKTIITEWNIPEGLKGDLKGIDSSALIQQLIVDLGRIRMVQDRGRTLDVNLVRGLQGLRHSGESRLTLTTRLQANYNALIGSVGSVEWGPLKVPVSVLMRPAQRLIGQRLVQITLFRDGSEYRLVATTDDGAAWVVTSKSSARIIPGLSAAPEIADIVRALAYMLAFTDGRTREPVEAAAGAYHFHEGSRQIVEYYRRGQWESTAAALELIKGSITNLQEAVALDPTHLHARHNLVLATLEQSIYLPTELRASVYTELLAHIKALGGLGEPARRLLIADLVLLAEALRTEQRLGEALEWFEKVKPLVQDRELRAYVLNNMGLVHQKLNHYEIARDYYRQALKEMPSYPRARVNIGNSFLDEGRFADAEHEYGAALKQTPDYGSALYNLGLLYTEMDAMGELSRFPDATACLGAQALRALRTYVAQFRQAEITSNLSEEEQENLEGGIELLSALETRLGAEATPATTYGNCLRPYRP